jgi:hypothetical protein
MMLTVRAGSVTLVEHIGSEPGEVAVHYIVPIWLRWLPVGVIVKINTTNHRAVLSVTT